VIVLRRARILSGLALYKARPAFGARRAVRGLRRRAAFHLLGLAALLVFTLGHVVLVLLHPRALASIFTGGRRA